MNTNIRSETKLNSLQKNLPIKITITTIKKERGNSARKSAVVSETSEVTTATTSIQEREVVDVGKLTEEVEEIHKLIHKYEYSEEEVMKRLGRLIEIVQVFKRNGIKPGIIEKKIREVVVEIIKDSKFEYINLDLDNFTENNQRKFTASKDVQVLLVRLLSEQAEWNVWLTICLIYDNLVYDGVSLGSYQELLEEDTKKGLGDLYEKVMNNDKNSLASRMLAARCLVKLKEYEYEVQVRCLRIAKEAAGSRYPKAREHAGALIIDIIERLQEKTYVLDPERTKLLIEVYGKLLMKDPKQTLDSECTNFLINEIELLTDDPSTTSSKDLLTKKFEELLSNDNKEVALLAMIYLVGLNDYDDDSLRKCLPQLKKITEKWAVHSRTNLIMRFIWMERSPYENLPKDILTNIEAIHALLRRKFKHNHYSHPWLSWNAVWQDKL